MSMSYSVNHLPHQDKPFRVGFFTPCWFPSMRHVCMPMLSSLNHLSQQSKQFCVWFFIVGLYVVHVCIKRLQSASKKPKKRKTSTHEKKTSVTHNSVRITFRHSHLKLLYEGASNLYIC